MPILARHLLAFTLLALAATAHARTDAAEPGIPLRDALILPAPDLAKLELEDRKRVGGAYRYGIQVPVALAVPAAGSNVAR